MLLDYLEDQPFKNPVQMGKALVRPMIKAPKGYKLIVSDYSSIENRVLAMHAEDDQTLLDFENDIDQYKTMAASKYNVPYGQVTDAQRFMGKVIILGCIAEGTLVVTDTGTIPIEQVTLTHKLWDGYTWVQHQGVLNKGKKECINYAGTWMTPDHKVFISDTKKEQVCQLVKNTQLETLGISLGTGKLLNMYREIRCLMNATRCGVISSSALCVTLDILEQMLVLYSDNLLNAETVEEKQNLGLVWKLIVKLQDSIKKLWIDLSIDGTLLKRDALIQKLLRICTTEGEGSRCVKNGMTLENFFSMLVPLKATMTQISNSTDEITMETTSQGILGSLRALKICRTHDILESGNLNRFTIITNKGPIIVSNCGYQMGGETFQKTCKIQFGFDISLEEAKIAVSDYREKYYLVKELWTGLQQAALRAVMTGERQTYNTITFGTSTVKGTRWLAMLMPSGKCVYYKNPQVRQQFIPKYEHMGKVPTVTAEGRDPYTRKWKRLPLTPGRITENATQGFAREIMARGMLNVQARMKEVALMGSVHDEALGLIKDTDITDDTMDIFNNHLCDIPFAPGLPIKAVGYISQRYKKD